MIDFILYYEKCSKHEAIRKAEQLTHAATTVKPAIQPGNERAMFLERMFTYFKNAIHNSKPAQEYLQSRCIKWNTPLGDGGTEVGYNAGQFHHGARKDESLINECLKYGLLLDSGMKARTGDTAYKPFGKWCICFALRNKTGEIASLYFRSTLQDKEQRHFYLRDRQGLYPGYPKAGTKKLILTESIIDAATLLQQETISTGYAVLALFGTNGLTEEHRQSISALQQLEEIIFFLNGDEAGNKAVAKYAPMFKAGYPNVKITHVAVPQNEDINSLVQGHSAAILTHLIETRKSFDFIFSNEPIEKKEEAGLFMESEASLSPIKNNNDCLQAAQSAPIATPAIQPEATGLDTNNPYNLKYQGNDALYHIKGFRAEQLDSLKITLQITVQ